MDMEQKAQMELDYNIKEALARKHMSQETLARRMGVSKQTVWNWCNGRTEAVKYGEKRDAIKEAIESYR